MTRTRSSGATPARRNACRVMAVGSASAATLVGRESGIRISPSAATVLYWQKAPRYPTKSADGTVQAHRRAAPSTGPARAAARCRIPHHPVARRPARAAWRGGHDARPFVAENGARFGVALQDHVQIGPADAALGDLDEHLAGSRLGTGHLLDGDLAVAHVDGCWHQW